MHPMIELLKILESLWKKTLIAKLPNLLKSQLLLLIAAGILAEVFFLTLLFGVGTLYWVLYQFHP